MSNLYICNTSTDTISKINLMDFKEEGQIPLRLRSQNKIGPHGICIYEDKLLTANSFGNSLSIISIDEGEEIENYFIGMNCNDVQVFEHNAYIVCGELNNIIVFNLMMKKIIEEIPCGSYPHSIYINKYNALAVVANMHSDSITIFDCLNRDNLQQLSVSEYPTKAIFSEDGQYIFVCESKLGLKSCGSLRIIDIDSLKTVAKIKLGNSPVDICTGQNYCYVSNFGDGTISIIDINKLKVIRKIRVGGMPRGIVANGNHVYVGDNYNNLLVKVDIKKENKEVISIGGEPTGMTLI
ncbi:YncE family protein [Candidatus Clostridium stratigraminis]|uniref:YncE family protein n=1 Tax=Candidatus Clostridium stratigraminis TaxID=3381661 RepID=A0ABW8T748_9CLOT